MIKNPYYIITGAPCTGKTTILNELNIRGYKCHSEIARKVIRENLDSGLEVFPWNQMTLFSDMVMDRMVELAKDFVPNELCFLDRSMVDLIGYMDFAKRTPPDRYASEAKKIGYANKVFFLPVWEDIYTKDEERKESFAEAKSIGDSLRKAYDNVGFEIIEVPKGDVKSRVDFMIEIIQ